jgi:thioredoxin
MKYTLFSIAMVTLVWLSSCGANVKNDQKGNESNGNQTVSNTLPNPGEGNSETTGEPIHLTKAEFLTKVYDFEKSPSEWVYAGNKPCIVDFYADWCKPCKMIAPILTELAGKYNGQLTVYKINVDEEKELAQFFGIQSIPTVLFCPIDGKPQMTQGALPKESFEKAINEVLLKNTKQ